MNDFFEVAPAATIIVDAEGLIVKTNRAFRRSVSSAFDTEGKLSFPVDHVHDEDKDRVVKACAEAGAQADSEAAPVKLSSVKTLILGEKGEFPVYELWDWLVQPFSGVGVILTGVPVHDKEKEEHELELQDFLNKAPIAMHWLSGTGHVLWCNDTELQVLGYKREEYIGQPIMKFVDAGDEALVLNIFKSLGSGNAIADVPVRFRNKAGKLVDLLIDSNVNWNADGSFRHTRCFIRDDTNRKVREARLEARAKYSEAVIREKDSFLRVLIHEMRTPIHILTGLMEEISFSCKDKLSDKLSESIADALAQCSRLGGLTRDISDAALFDSGLVLTPSLKPLEPRQFMALVVGEAKSIGSRTTSSAQETNDVTVKVSVSTPRYISTDEDMLRRALVHLVANAVQHASSHVELNLDYNKDEETATFVVKDFGRGMDEVEVQKAFHAYYKGTGSHWDEESEKNEGGEDAWQRLENEAKGGVGIGLNVSFNMVQCLGGDLKFEKVEGGGCCFSFSCKAPDARNYDESPAVVAKRTSDARIDWGEAKKNWRRIEDAKSLTSAHYVSDTDGETNSTRSLSDAFTDPAGSEGEESPRKKNEATKDVLKGAVGISMDPPVSVLIVDDSGLALKIMKRILTRLGCSVMTASNGLEACNIMEVMGNVFDAVLCDLRMPIMDGYTATKQIRSMGFDSVPIYIVTAEAGTEFRNKCLAAGATGYEVKPLSQSVLVGIVDGIKRKRLETKRLPGLNLNPTMSSHQVSAQYCALQDCQ